jgi:hypothetical protein
MQFLLIHVAPFIQKVIAYSLLSKEDTVSEDINLILPDRSNMAFCSSVGRNSKSKSFPCSSYDIYSVFSSIHETQTSLR